MNRHQVAKAVLYTLAGAGFVVVAITAPNLVQVFRQYSRKNTFKTKQLSNCIDRLQRNQLISKTYQGGKCIIQLTKNGQEKVLKYRLDDLSIPKMRKWDRKWRVVIFDIPEKFRLNRIHFSNKVKELGFFALQKSVWVYPYPCENEIDFIKEIYEVREFVRIVTAESIDLDNDLLKKFNLA